MYHREHRAHREERETKREMDIITETTEDTENEGEKDLNCSFSPSLSVRSVFSVVHPFFSASAALTGGV
jgi:hypothetical protein